MIRIRKKTSLFIGLNQIFGCLTASVAEPSRFSSAPDIFFRFWLQVKISSQKTSAPAPAKKPRLRPAPQHCLPDSTNELKT